MQGLLCNTEIMSRYAIEKHLEVCEHRIRMARILRWKALEQSWTREADRTRKMLCA